jgi:hypothetical protein
MHSPSDERKRDRPHPEELLEAALMGRVLGLDVPCDEASIRECFPRFCGKNARQGRDLVRRFKQVKIDLDEAGRERLLQAARGLTLGEAENVFARIIVQAERIAKERLTPEERKALATERKAQRELLKEKYGHAMVNGERVELGNYIAEPSGIFMGRGKHPLRGKWKQGAQKKDITLNLSSADHLTDQDAGPRSSGSRNRCGWRAGKTSFGQTQICLGFLTEIAPAKDDIYP